MNTSLSIDEKRVLLRLARQALENAVRGVDLPGLDEAGLTPALRAIGASFVTLTIGGQLRGCIGSLQAYQPLVEDVLERAVSAGVEDYRFPPVRASELPLIRIEISRLTAPTRLDYTDSHDLLAKLCPGVDGVILSDGSRRATFLPQVWEKITDRAEFLRQLCAKMGAAADLWQRKHLDIKIYQVEEFHEQ